MKTDSGLHNKWKSIINPIYVIKLRCQISVIKLMHKTKCVQDKYLNIITVKLCIAKTKPLKDYICMCTRKKKCYIFAMILDKL